MSAFNLIKQNGENKVVTNVLKNVVDSINDNEHGTGNEVASGLQSALLVGEDSDEAQIVSRNDIYSVEELN